jgi:hypothetical protein
MGLKSNAFICNFTCVSTVFVYYVICIMHSENVVGEELIKDVVCLSLCSSFH